MEAKSWVLRFLDRPGKRKAVSRNLSMLGQKFGNEHDVILCIRYTDFQVGKCVVFSLFCCFQRNKNLHSVAVSKQAVTENFPWYSCRWKKSCETCFPKMNNLTKKCSTTEFQIKAFYNCGDDLAVFKYTNSAAVFVASGSFLVFKVLLPENQCLLQQKLWSSL